LGIRPHFTQLLAKGTNLNSNDRLQSMDGRELPPILHPTPCQKNLIPTLLSGSDLLIKDITGSGKTLGLVLAALSKSHPFIDSLRMEFDHGSASKESLVSEFSRVSSVPTSKKYLHTLILVPSRDLALQVTHWIQYLLGLLKSPSSNSSLIKEDQLAQRKIQCLISGVDPSLQISRLTQHPPQIVVGTPVRTLEILNHDQVPSPLDLSNLQLLIADEIDRLITVPSRYATLKDKFKHKVHLSPGQDLIHKIIQSRHEITFEESKKGRLADPVKKTRLQFVACSATLNSNLRLFLKNQKNWLKDPVVLNVSGTKTTPETLHHSAGLVSSKGIYILDWTVQPQLKEETSPGEQESKEPKSKETEISKEKGEATLSDDDPLMLSSLSHLIHSQSHKTGIIFTQSTVSVRKLVQNLKELGLDAARLIDVTDYTSESMGSSKIGEGVVVKRRLPKWIVLTEHEARGLDLPHVETVFILGLPSSPASYLHMAGRAGRAGRKGNVVTLMGGEKYVSRFEKMMRLLQIPCSTSSQIIP
jgi:superfamily II DNA/RNA helicase